MAAPFLWLSESSSPNIPNENKEDKEVTSLFALFRILPLCSGFCIWFIYDSMALHIVVVVVRLLWAMNYQPVLYCRSHWMHIFHLVLCAYGDLDLNTNL